jgi:hypothetical protein
MTTILERRTTALEELLETMFRGLERIDPDALEGRVMSEGPPPYRRIDLDGRALAYVRARPKRRALRVDVTGLWKGDLPCALKTETATGSACLIVRTRADVDEAIRFLHESVQRTRRVRSIAARSLRF